MKLSYIGRVTINLLYRLIGVVSVITLLIIPIVMGEVFARELEPEVGFDDKVGPVRTDVSQINSMNRVHRRSNIWINITNRGYFGNDTPGRSTALNDPCRSGEWAQQCEYPGGTGVQYLFQGGLWIGALVRAEGFEYPRVSVATDGWINGINEFWPGEGGTNSQSNGIIERTTLPLEFDCIGNPIGRFRDEAVSEQDFVCSYADTLTETFYLNNDPIDGPHSPLGVKVTQKSFAWTYNYAQNFIIIDWEIENIAGNYLKNLYIGLYLDADVGHRSENLRYEDDICGFQKWYYYERPDGREDRSLINTAWIADNDGRRNGVEAGNDYESSGVTGVRVVRAPNPELKTSFNWWISNGNVDLDFGPSWRDDGAPGGWTDAFGTPSGDVKKYFILSNREFDYDQTYVNDAQYISENPQLFTDRWDSTNVKERHDWKIPGVEDTTPENLLNDLQNGYDTRYLLSWGPLGIFDHIDEAGNRIYRLNPGEKFSMTIGYIAGDNFHDRNNPQNDVIIDPEKFNFNSLRYNADWAARVYDNPMIDTPIHDWGNDNLPGTGDLDGSEGDGILDTGDGWYGEDLGEDGLFAVKVGATAYKWEGGVRREYTYLGPDEGENDGSLSQAEDGFERPEALDYTRLNGMLDFGDGYPDFQGPPPPPSPDLVNVSDPVTIHVTEDSVISISDEFLSKNVVLSWSKYISEDSLYADPFSREWDFEGYRVYISSINVEKSFSFMDEFDRIDYALYSARDSLGSRPVSSPDSLPADTLLIGERLFRKPVGSNIGYVGHENFVYDIITHKYYYIVPNAHPMVPMYYSVTSFDYGDYKTGTQSLESAKIANSVYVAPSGIENRKVRVVPNPYRVSEDYRAKHGGISWENRDDGTSDFFPQVDRRLTFYDLPRSCLIRIYTISGDLVVIIPHNYEGDLNQGWEAPYAETWNLNSRNLQQVVSGTYLFSVENMTSDKKGEIEVGKFVVIR